MKTNIILIGYQKRVGKDTFANFLKKELENNNSKVEIVHFADALKEILADTFNVSREQLEDYKNNVDSITVRGQIISNFREIHQRFGSGKIKEIFGGSIWKKILELSFKDDTIYIIPDFRFPEEFIDDSLTIKIYNSTKVSSDKHISENALKDFKFDLEYDNKKSFKDLQNFAKKVVKKYF